MTYRAEPNGRPRPELRPGPADGTLEPWGVVLVTELFPPDCGGTATVFGNVYPRMAGVPLTVIRDSGAAASSEESLGDVRMVRIPMGARHWGLTSMGSLGRYRRVMAHVVAECRRRRSVVHCGRALPEGLAALGAARLFGSLQYICWTHGEELEYARSSRELSFLQRRVHRGASAMVANCRTTARRLEDLGVPREKVHVVYPGVDAARFGRPGAGAAIRQRYLGDAELLLITVGRLQRRKGHDLVIEALAETRPALQRVRYLVVGDGEERARLEQMVDRFGLRDRVSFAGGVPADALPEYYAAGDIFVHPNRVDGLDVEGFGIVFLEAAAAGLPTIGGATGGVPEAIGEGETGLLVSGTDKTELVAALETLAAAEVLRRRMGAAGRARVLREFTWDRAARDVTEIQRRVLEGT